MLKMMQPGSPMDTLPDTSLADMERRRLLLEADTFGEGITGGFFGAETTPSDLPSSYRFERMGSRRHKLVLRIRSLPTAEVVAFVRDKCGERSRALMDEWRGLFDSLPGGAEGLAKLAGFEPDFDYSAEQHLLAPRVLSNLARGQGGSAEANELYRAALAARELPPARRPEQHLLEDASIMTALVRHRVPVTFAAFYGGASAPHLLKFGARGKPRVIRPSKREAMTIYEGFGSNNSYWVMPSFNALCGRRMVETTSVRHLTLTLLDMARQGMKRAFLKDTVFKGGTWVIELEGVDSEARAASRLIETLGPNWFHLLARSQGSGGERRMVVQEFTPFEREHRFFCVGGRIVASTASDRGLTVFDAPPPHRRLDCRVAVLDSPAEKGGVYDRGRTSSVEDRDLVARMARLVRRLLREIEENDFIGRALLPKAFVVDAGAGPGGIGLIEINTFRNSGLYGADYDRIARAMKDADKWPDWVRAFDAADDDGLDADQMTVRRLGQVARWVVKLAPAVSANGPASVWSLIETVDSKSGEDPEK